MATPISSRLLETYYSVQEVQKHSDSTLALRILKSIPARVFECNLDGILFEAERLGPITKEYKHELLHAYLRYLSETSLYFGSKAIANIFKKNLEDADALITQTIIHTASYPDEKKRRLSFEAFVDLCSCIRNFSESYATSKEFFLKAAEQCPDALKKARIYSFFLLDGEYGRWRGSTFTDASEVGEKLLEITPHLAYKDLIKACCQLVQNRKQTDETKTSALDIAFQATLHEPLVSIKALNRLIVATWYRRNYLNQTQKNLILEFMDKDFGPLTVSPFSQSIDSFNDLNFTIDRLRYIFATHAEKEAFYEKRAKMGYRHLKLFVEKILEHKNEVKIEYNKNVFICFAACCDSFFPREDEKARLNPLFELAWSLMSDLKNGLSLELNEKQELKGYEGIHFDPFAKSDRRLKIKYFFDPDQPKYKFEQDELSSRTFCQIKSKHKEKADYPANLADEDEYKYAFALQMLSLRHPLEHENSNIEPILETISVAAEYAKSVKDEDARKILKLTALEFYLSPMYSAFLNANSKPLHKIVTTLIQSFEFTENDRPLFEECIYRKTKGQKHIFPWISVAVKDILVLWKALNVDHNGFSFIPNLISVAQKVSCPLNQVFGFFKPVYEFGSSEYPFSLFFGNNFAEYIDSREFTLPQVVEMGTLMLRSPWLTKNQIRDILSIVQKVAEAPECELKPFLNYLSALSPHLKTHKENCQPFVPKILSILRKTLTLPDRSVIKQENVFDGVGLDFINGISNIYTFHAFAKDYLIEKSHLEVLRLQTDLEANIITSYLKRLRLVTWDSLTPVEINAYLKLFRPFVESLNLNGLESNLIHQANAEWNKLLVEVPQWHHKVTDQMGLVELEKRWEM